MSWVVNAFRSAVVKKAVMAVTGIILFGFVLGHMLGNLKLYMGPEKLNAYAEWLREVGYPLLPHSGLLWIARVGLLVAVALHLWSAWAVTRASWAARPVDYAVRRVQKADYASRTMRWGGVIIALFVFFHLSHLTWGLGWAHPVFVAGDVYSNVVRGFQVWWASLFYIVANVFLGFHLYHGLWSMFQSLGWNHPRYNLWRRRFAQVFSILVSAVNISFPLSVLTGLVS